MRRRTILTMMAIAAATLATGVAAQDYPTRPVRVIVPQPPGGGFDVVGRIAGQKLGEFLGQQVVVENRPGAGTLLGTETAAKAPADGYTLVVGALSNIALNPGLYRSLPYDPVKDLTPVGLVASYSFTLVAHKGLPVNSLKDLVAYAKANPGKLNYASAGNGTGQHICTAILAHMTGMNMVHVPYRGAQLVYPDLMSGQVQLFFDNSGTAKPFIDRGDVKPLVISSPTRSKTQPQIPTIRETGVVDFAMVTWFGLFAPAATPPAILARLRSEMTKLAKAPDVVDRFEKTGAVMVDMPAADLVPFVRGEIEKWSNLVRQTGIVLE